MSTNENDLENLRTIVVLAKSGITAFLVLLLIKKLQREDKVESAALLTFSGNKGCLSVVH